jgi:hypothetical protein
MEGLGQLGFWLAAGAVIVAQIMRTWLRERDKQAFLRDMMNVEGGDKITEIITYLREKDAADRQLQRQLSGVDWWNGLNWQRIGAVVAAIVVALAALYLGLLSNFVFFKGSESRFVPLGMMVACWVAGGVIAWLIVRSSRNKKNDSPPIA